MVSKRVGNVAVVGYSIAGEETTVALPELNVCFDAGRAPREMVPIDTLCVSHGHMDHAAGIPYYFSQRTFIGASAGRLVIHKALVRPVQALMAAWAEIERHPSPAEYVGVEPGDEVPLRRDLFVRAFAVVHDARALGFSVIERRHKLKPEYADYTGPQLVELKKRGVQIQNTIEVPLVAYCGDTADGPFFDLDHVRNAHLLILECTFFDADHVVRARAGKHLHVKDLRGILPRVRNPNILLTHVTRRTDMRAARRAIEAIVEPADMARLTFLMDRPRRRDRAAAEPDPPPGAPPADSSGKP
jgi:ribonuclease Z